MSFHTLISKEVKFMQKNDVKKQIEKLLEDKPYVVIAIDGRCAAGKTTLASELQEELSCVVIHMDDFFLRPEQRTNERLQTPGGNVDYERFLEEVLLPLHAHHEFSYRRYDCHTQSFKESIEVPKSRIVIVEGTYACHPVLWQYYDLHIFLNIDAEEQKERILKRNGVQGAVAFMERWIPLEEAYFANCHKEVQFMQKKLLFVP